MNILLGITGSVATVLVHKMIEELQKLGEVRVVMTETATRFLPEDFYVKYVFPYQEKIKEKSGVVFYSNYDEWTWDRKPDDPARLRNKYPETTTDKWYKDAPILHITLRNWADVFVIAPMSANTLAKVSNGLCDNLLTTIARAWDFRKPLIFAPAMNDAMFIHRITSEQIGTLVRWGAWEVRPQTKKLACGETGIGAMADIGNIAYTIRSSTRWKWPLMGPYLATGAGIPISEHPGAWGVHRKHDIHTGVDLYCAKGTPVFAAESGRIIKIIWFTGKNVLGKDDKPMDWWLDTQAVLVKGPSGVVVYGEITPMFQLKEGDFVGAGEQIGNVAQVLPNGKERPDIKGHSLSMLHIELYSSAYENLERFVWEGWELGTPCPEKLLNPTDKLIEAAPSTVGLMSAIGIIPSFEGIS